MKNNGLSEERERKLKFEIIFNSRISFALRRIMDKNDEQSKQQQLEIENFLKDGRKRTQIHTRNTQKHIQQAKEKQKIMWKKWWRNCVLRKILKYL